jgi:UDP-N-acetylglucosamine 3-dehydrogenase
VTGERGMYVVDYITQDLVFYANPDASEGPAAPAATDDGAAPASVSEGEMTKRVIERREPLAVELEEFARAVRDGGPPPVDPRDAMIALLLARKMVESATTGQVVAGPALQTALS